MTLFGSYNSPHVLNFRCYFKNLVSETFEFSKHIIRRGVRKIEFWVLENLRVGIKEIRGLGTLTGRLLDRGMVKGRGMNTGRDRLVLRRGQICMGTSVVRKVW